MKYPVLGPTMKWLKDGVKETDDMLDFYKTKGGRQFFDRDVVNISLALQAIAKQMKRKEAGSCSREMLELFNAAEALIPLWERQDVADEWDGDFNRLHKALGAVRKVLWPEK